MPPKSKRSGNVSDYPPLLSSGSHELPPQPYYSPQLAPPPTSRYQNQPTDDDIDDDDENLLDGVPHVSMGRDEREAEDTDESVSDQSDQNSTQVPKAFGTAHVRSDDPGEGRRGAARGRPPGRREGRGRGSLKALLEFEARKRGEPSPTSLRSRGRGSRTAPSGGTPSRAAKRRRRHKNQENPTEEFKNLQSVANNAFLAGDYDTALSNAQQAVHINPEIFASHSLLSEIYFAMGKIQESLMVLWSGAHTKREPGVWWEVANRTAELSIHDDFTRDDNLLYCYSRIAIINKDDVAARRGRLSIYIKRGSDRHALRECRAILKVQPSDLNILQILAEISMQAEEIPQAIEAYDKAIQLLQLMPPDSAASSFTFSQLNIFLELFSKSGDYASGLVKLKSVSRWLCGRKDETFWDDYQADDREWDFAHEPRRAQVPEFQPGQYPLSTYGRGLPVEIRAKMGIFRLRLGPSGFSEALHHFQILKSGIQTSGDPMIEYQDLLREIADTLFSCKHFQEALRIYEPLVNAHGILDTNLRVHMAVAYKEQKMYNLAKHLYQDLEQEDPENPHYLVALAKICEEEGDTDKAMQYVSLVIGLGRRDVLRRANLKSHPSFSNDGAIDDDDEQDEDYMPETGMRKPRSKNTTITMRKALPDADLFAAYERFKELRPLMRAGDEAATKEWMKLAESLMDDFRSMGVFFPSNKYIRFLGYDPDSRRKAVALKPGQPYTEAEIMAQRLLAPETGDHSQNSSNRNEKDAPAFIPLDYRTIRFDDWLDIFCEYALEAARADKSRDCFAALETATKANVFYHNPKRLLHVHICLFTCALMLNDEENMCQAARWVIKTYPGCTDGYRLYAALGRLYKGDLNWYHSGPSQKFIMRQIKMIDLAILGDSDEQTNRFEFESHDRRQAEAVKASTTRTSHHQNTVADQDDQDDQDDQEEDYDEYEAAGVYVVDMAGLGPPEDEDEEDQDDPEDQEDFEDQEDPADQEDQGEAPTGEITHDPVLLTLYGHMLATNGSYRNALNYYFRAYAVDPNNAMIMLSITVGYLQMAMKRQTLNRHSGILQADAFMKKYKELRLDSIEQESQFTHDGETAEQRQSRLQQMRHNRTMEVEFNEGRLWHMVGLNHLAIPPYERCLAMPDLESSDHDDPDFKREAAFCLQQLFASSGDLEKAQEVTRKYLVF